MAVGFITIDPAAGMLDGFSPIIYPFPLTQMYNTNRRVSTGSIAAVAQSLIGDIAAGSLFAILQSASVGGYGLFAVNAIVSGSSAVVASAVSWDTAMKYKERGEKRKTQ